jgi:hypothetical protein
MGYHDLSPQQVLQLSHFSLRYFPVQNYTAIGWERDESQLLTWL